MFPSFPFPLFVIVTVYTAFLLFGTDFPSPVFFIFFYFFFDSSDCCRLYLYANDVPSSPLNLSAQTPLSDTNYAVANGGACANSEIEVGFIWWKP